MSCFFYWDLCNSPLPVVATGPEEEKGNISFDLIPKYLNSLSVIKDLLMNPVYYGAMASQKKNCRFKIGTLSKKSRMNVFTQFNQVFNERQHSLFQRSKFPNALHDAANHGHVAIHRRVLRDADDEPPGIFGVFDQADGVPDDLPLIVHLPSGGKV